ncbi:MAG TPA: OmpA family protein [Polyangia bacterium]|nr:OmpA family protein [Polyangia bacterium]
MKWLAVALALAAAAAGGCAGVELEGQVRGIQNLNKTARENGAYKCAPRELALAESNVEFAATELHEGDYFRAREHLRIADENARAALASSPREKCNPTVVVLGDRDTDGDGIPDSRDKCPTEPEDKDGFQDEDGCPDPDNDQDGIPDVRDKCPNEPEDKDGFQDEDGCPDPDNDKDGILDKDDKCPNEPGPKENDGCPDKDTDGDGIVDRLDKCPLEPGPPGSDGCPQKFKLIVVTNEKIELKQKIYFATAKTNILPKSFPLMNEVTEALRTRPGIRVRIEGHTDIRGGHEYNMKLSQGRANSVRQYLVDHGIDPSRMEPIGYGPDRPVATNKTAGGREQNRRVEFFIVAEPAPTPGPSAPTPAPPSPKH